MGDWTALLTEGERQGLVRAYAALKRVEEERMQRPWYRRSPARAKAIVSAYRSLAASRALVAEQRSVLEKFACVCTSADIGDGGDERIVTGCFLHDPALALTEADMLELGGKEVEHDGARPDEWGGGRRGHERLKVKP